MEAKQIRGAVVALLLAAVPGCQVGTTVTPTMSKPADPAGQTEPEVEVVQTQTAREAADESVELASAIQGYIQRIDEVDRRVEAAPASLPPEPPVPVDAQHVPPDTDAATTADPTSDVKPEREAAPTSAARQAEAEQPDSADHQGAAPQQPPRLARVTAQALPELAANTPGSNSTPANRPAKVNASVTARQAPVSLEQFLEQWPGDAEDASFREQFDLRLLRIIAGDYDGAREPLNMVSQQQQEIARRFIDSLIAVRQAHEGEFSYAASRVRDELNRLGESLRPLSELRIPQLILCREVTGFGQYDPLEPPRFPTGLASEFVVYCELQDFVSERRDDGFYHSRFEMRTVLLNRAGDVILEIRDTDIVDRCRNPRKDCFIPRLVRLPATLSPGEYVVKVTVIDKLGEKVAESRATLQCTAGR